MKCFKIILCLLATCSVVMGIRLGADASTGHRNVGVERQTDFIIIRMSLTTLPADNKQTGKAALETS